MSNKDDSVPGGLLSRVVRLSAIPPAASAGRGHEVDHQNVRQADAQGDDRAQAAQRLRAQAGSTCCADAPQRCWRARIRACAPRSSRAHAVQAGRPRHHAQEDRRIEAQMSLQWWKTKHGGNSQVPGTSRRQLSDVGPRAAGCHAAARGPGGGHQLFAHLAGPQEAGGRGAGVPTIQVARRVHRGWRAGTGPRTPQSPPAAPQAAQTGAAKPPLSLDLNPPRARSQRQVRPACPAASTFAVQTVRHQVEFAHDPELEASIHFHKATTRGRRPACWTCWRPTPPASTTTRPG